MPWLRFSASLVVALALVGVATAGEIGSSRSAAGSDQRMHAMALLAAAAGFFDEARMSARVKQLSKLGHAEKQVVHAVVNTLLVAVVIRLERGTPLFTAWNQTGLWTAGSTLASVVVGAGLFWFFEKLGIAGLLLGLGGATVVSAYYRVAGRQYRPHRRELSSARDDLLRGPRGTAAPDPPFPSDPPAHDLKSTRR